ncbi:DUF5050 domain-containing protein [Blautia schinkii]|nr:DUF5050 domain-containing protein [Blautia schinkii]
MRRYGKFVLPLLVLICVLVSGVSVLAAGRMEGVTASSTVFVHEKGVVFYGWNNTLCTALLDENGNVYDFVTEGHVPEDITDLAVDGNYLYLATYGGLFRVDLNEHVQDASQAQLLYENSLINGFEIYGNYVYYRAGNTLQRTPADHQEEESLLTGISDYQLTKDGIYYTDSDGGLFYVNHDGSGKAYLTDTAADASIVIQGDYIYYWGDEETLLHRYNLETSGTEDISPEQEFDGGEYIWVTDDYLVYSATDREVYKYYLEDGREEHLDKLYSLPDRDEGTLYNEVIYQSLAATVYWMDLRNNTNNKADMEEILAAPASGETEENTSDASVGNIGFNISDGINVHASEGSALLTTDYFQLYLPMDVLWDYEVVNSDTIKLVLASARDEGYGGVFVTIKAYDWGDDSYADIPRYTIAGVSEAKKYVAIFPTDVQYNPNDAEQTAAYQRLADIAARIDANGNSDDNPFIVMLP